MKEMNLSKKTMSSLEIAEITGKPHKDVLKAIRAMEGAWHHVTERKFSLSEYKDSTGRTLPCYAMEPAREKVSQGKFSLSSRAVVQPNSNNLKNTNIMKEMYYRMVDALMSENGGTLMMVAFIVIMALLLGPIVEIFG